MQDTFPSSFFWCRLNSSRVLPLQFSLTMSGQKWAPSTGALPAGTLKLVHLRAWQNTTSSEGILAALNRGRWRRGSAWDSARCPPPSPPSSLPTHLPCCQKTRRRRETRSACYHDTLRDSREHYGYLRDSTSLYGCCRILRLDTRLRGTAQHGRIYEYEPMRNATRQQRQRGLFWILSIVRSPWNNQPDICF